MTHNANDSSSLPARRALQLFVEPWFFHPAGFAAGQEIVLDHAEARHARSARRLGEGDAICLFDGRGQVGRATLVNINSRPKQMICNVHDAHTVEQPPALHIVAALPKGDRLWTMLNMLGQLAAASFTPLTAERSVIRKKAALHDRGQRILIEACKQSRNPYLPLLHEPIDIKGVLARADQTEAWLLVAHPDGEPLHEVAKDSAGRSHIIAIGPEGGFTPDEVEQLVSGGAAACSLGSTILRIEVAAVAAAAILHNRSTAGESTSE